MWIQQSPAVWLPRAWHWESWDMAILKLFISKAAAPPPSPALRMLRGELALMFPSIVQVPNRADQGFTPLRHTQRLKWLGWKRNRWQVLVRNTGPQLVPPKLYTSCWNIKEEKTKGSVHMRVMEVEELTWIWSEPVRYACHSSLCLLDRNWKTKSTKTMVRFSKLSREAIFAHQLSSKKMQTPKDHLHLYRVVFSAERFPGVSRPELRSSDSLRCEQKEC